MQSISGHHKESEGGWLGGRVQRVCQSLLAIEGFIIFLHILRFVG